MNTLGQAIKNMAEVDARIGIGLKDGKMAIKIELGSIELYWSASTARKIALQWINSSMEGMMSEGGVTGLILQADEFQALISPEALHQAGLDMLTAAGVLSGIGVVHTWLEDAHGFGIDVEAVCASIQPPKEPESLSS
jgi:hypothetical protein